MVYIMSDIGSIQNPHGETKISLKCMSLLMLSILKFHHKNNIFKDNIETHIHDLG